MDQPVQLHVLPDEVVMDNGIVKVTISNPGGFVTHVQYKGIDNILEFLNKEDNRGYWDIVWGVDVPPIPGALDNLKATTFKVIVQSDEQIELSFQRMWDYTLENKVVPLNIHKRFIMLRGSSGFYTYAFFEHLPEWPAFNISVARLVFKLRKDKFHYMAIADNRKRDMPLPDDRMPGRGQPLGYKEAVLLVNPIEPEFKGEVDDKYQYSSENKDIKVHGWICKDPLVGFWQITPSYEDRSGGPVKQNLTSHVGPTSLSVFHSAHYSGVNPRFAKGEPWKKVFGPVFVYFNSGSEGDDLHHLWEDASTQMMKEVQLWPYSFPALDEFQKAATRGKISGRLLVRDRYMSDVDMPGKGAFVGLATPGEKGSWQIDSKGYQFWTTADENGFFSISAIRTGNYNLYAWVPGFVDEYHNIAVITISPGSTQSIGDVIYQPPRYGPTLWEIGYPDRSAAGFFIPNPNPMYINKLYVNHPDRYRQYGLWERYADLFPHEDLVYSVGTSDYRKDYFFAQVTRKIGEKYHATTWQIKFKLANVETGMYKLQLALASAEKAALEVHVNDPHAHFLFTTGAIGNENAIARHGIHGLYWFYGVDVPHKQLIIGNNTIFLTQRKSDSPFNGVMYDYLRLEGPPIHAQII